MGAKAGCLNPPDVPHSDARARARFFGHPKPLPDARRGLVRTRDEGNEREMPPISGTMIKKQTHPDERALCRLRPQSGQKACSLLQKRASRWLMRKREMKREKQTQVGKHTQEHD